jgi:hypothetical protein
MFDMEWFLNCLSESQRKIPILITHGLGSNFTKDSLVNLLILEKKTYQV